MRHRVEEKVAAIMAVEVVDFDRLKMDEEAAAELQILYHEVIDAEVAIHGGRIFELEPDHLRAEFESPLTALRCAVRIQHGIAQRQATEAAPPIGLRIGIHLDEFVVDGGELTGKGLEFAWRVCGAARAGEICVSRTVVEALKRERGIEFVDVATLGNGRAPRPGLAFRVHAALDTGDQVNLIRRLTLATAAGLAVIAGATALWYVTRNGHWLR